MTMPLIWIELQLTGLMSDYEMKSEEFVVVVLRFEYIKTRYVYVEIGMKNYKHSWISMAGYQYATYLWIGNRQYI